MAVTTYAVTGNVSDLVDADLADGRVSVRVETNLPVDADGHKAALVLTTVGGKKIRLGDATKKTESGGTFSFAELVASNSDDTNIESGTLQYQVHIDYPRASDGRRDTWPSGWFSLTGDIDLADVVAEQAIPAAFQSTFIAEALGYLAQQESLAGIDDTDTAVAYAAQHGALTPGVLSATIDAIAALNAANGGTALGAALLGGFLLRGGPGITAKPNTDKSAGFVDLNHDSDTGYLFHLKTRSNTSGSTALLGLGGDQGFGSCLLVSNKAGGVGVTATGAPTMTGVVAQFANFSPSTNLLSQIYVGAGGNVKQLSTSAGFPDGVTRNGKTTLASALALFTAADVGQGVSQLTSRALDDPSGCVPAGATITAVVDTTVAAGSNGAVLPQAIIALASVTNLPTGGGSIAITSDAGVQIINYTGVSGSSITGCTGGTGTLSTGAVAKVAVMSAAAGSSGSGINIRVMGRTPALTQAIEKTLDHTGATIKRETRQGIELFAADPATAVLRATGASGHTGNVAEVLLFGNATPALAVQSTGRTRQVFSALISNAGLTTQNALQVQNFSATTATVYLQAHSAQGADQLTLADSSTVTQFRFNKAGYPITKKTTAPADADLGNTELTQWHDPTNGAAKAMFKGKETGGTVRSISLPLSPVTLAAAATDAATTQTLVNDLRAKLIATGMYA